MPVYEYQCEKCKKNFEFLQKVDDAPIEKCEECGGDLHKTFGKMTFHLYGPGFYTTDNKKKYLK